MLLKETDFVPVIKEWLNTVIYPKSSAWQIVLYETALGVGEKTGKLKTFLQDKLAFLANDDGSLDLDLIEPIVKEAFNTAGGKVEIPYISWIADSEDLDLLFTIARKHKQ